MSIGDWHWLDALRRRWAAEQTEWAQEYFTGMACEDPLEDHPMAAPLTYRQSTLRVRKIRWKGRGLIDYEADKLDEHFAKAGALAVHSFVTRLYGVHWCAETTVTWPEPKQ